MKKARPDRGGSGRAEILRQQRRRRAPRRSSRQEIFRTTARLGTVSGRPGMET